MELKVRGIAVSELARLALESLYVLAGIVDTFMVLDNGKKGTGNARLGSEFLKALDSYERPVIGY